MNIGKSLQIVQEIVQGWVNEYDSTTVVGVLEFEFMTGIFYSQRYRYNRLVNNVLHSIFPPLDLDRGIFCANLRRNLCTCFLPLVQI